MKNRGLLDRLKNYVKIDRSIMNLYEGCKTMIKNKTTGKWKCCDKNDKNEK
jgi:hypothetical protein